MAGQGIGGQIRGGRVIYGPARKAESAFARQRGVSPQRVGLLLESASRLALLKEAIIIL